jgi:hypothetical protein
VPHLTNLIGPNGALIAVTVSVTAARATALQAAGQPIPQPQNVQLQVDTGAFCTALDTSVIAALALQPKGSIPIRTPSTGAGTYQCSTYDVELTIACAGGSKVVPALEIIEGQFLPQGHHGLLGRDVLADGRLIYTGPDKAILLSF